MNARVFPGTKLPFVKAFGGYEFLHGTWRVVPEGFEEAARAHPLLEVQEEEEATEQELLPSTTELASVGAEEVTEDENGGPTLQRSGSGRRRGSNL